MIILQLHSQIIPVVDMTTAVASKKNKTKQDMQARHMEQKTGKVIKKKINK